MCFSMRRRSAAFTILTSNPVHVHSIWVAEEDCVDSGKHGAVALMGGGASKTATIAPPPLPPPPAPRLSSPKVSHPSTPESGEQSSGKQSGKQCGGCGTPEGSSSSPSGLKHATVVEHRGMTPDAARRREAALAASSRSGSRGSSRPRSRDPRACEDGGRPRSRDSRGCDDATCPRSWECISIDSATGASRSRPESGGIRPRSRPRSGGRTLDEGFRPRSRDCAASDSSSSGERPKSKERYSSLSGERPKSKERSRLQEAEAGERRGAAAELEAEPISWQRGQLLGTGSFGQVYFGMNSRTGELMAVKQIQFGAPLSAAATMNAQALQRELITLQGLSHPNIVRYLGVERDECAGRSRKYRKFGHVWCEYSVSIV